MTSMRTCALLIIALLLLGGATAAQAKDINCERCGMKWGASVTRLIVDYKDKSTHYFESMACLFQTTTRDNIRSVTVADYGSKNASEMIQATSAHYLYDTEHLSHSMPPFIAAFKTKDAALKAQKDLGGDYMTFDQVWSALAKHFRKRGDH